MKAVLLVIVLARSCCGFLLDSNIHGGTHSFWERPLDSKAQGFVDGLKQGEHCTSIFEACSKLTDAIHENHIAYTAVHELSKTFSQNYNAVPADCTCSGTPQLWQFETQSHHSECRSFDRNYNALYDHFFGSGDNTKLGCNTHRSLWHGLVTLTNHHDVRPRLCQWTLIQELSAAYKKHRNSCTCNKATQLQTDAPTTQKTTTSPTTTTTTTPKPTTTSTTTTPKPTTTTPMPTTTIVYPPKVCDKFKVIEAVGKGSVVMSSGSTACSNVQYGPSDALVTEACATGQTSTWRKGNNVVSLCQNNAIPPYTAIASFQPDVTTFQTVGHIAAVLIKCEQDGIQIAFQDCGQEPILKHLTNGGFGQLDPNSYYTITV